MENKEFGKELEKRTRRFAVEIIHMSGSLPSSSEMNVIRNQLTKSGTSIGANYREANHSRSRSDFFHRIKICETESNETCFWLEVLDDLNIGNQEKVRHCLSVSSEFLAIFTSISNGSKPK